MNERLTTIFRETRFAVSFKDSEGFYASPELINGLVQIHRFSKKQAYLIAGILAGVNAAPDKDKALDRAKGILVKKQKD